MPVARQRLDLGAVKAGEEPVRAGGRGQGGRERVGAPVDRQIIGMATGKRCREVGENSVDPGNGYASNERLNDLMATRADGFPRFGIDDLGHG